MDSFRTNRLSGICCKSFEPSYWYSGISCATYEVAENAGVAIPPLNHQPGQPRLPVAFQPAKRTFRQQQLQPINRVQTTTSSAHPLPSTFVSIAPAQDTLQLPTPTNQSQLHPFEPQSINYRNCHYMYSHHQSQMFRVCRLKLFLEKKKHIAIFVVTLPRWLTSSSKAKDYIILSYEKSECLNTNLLRIK